MHMRTKSGQNGSNAVKLAKNQVLYKTGHRELNYELNI